MLVAVCLLTNEEASFGNEVIQSMWSESLYWVSHICITCHAMTPIWSGGASAVERAARRVIVWPRQH